jgi:hypothetical protein
MGQERRAPVGNLERWCKRAQRALGKFKAIPTAMRLVLICIAVLVVFSVTNLVYQILHKPTEVFALIPGESNKAPIETWRQYAPLFREYSTASISPELLAALAQVESAGNPIARTYWRWSLSSDPFAVYQPASSAVGMYQMTDAALSEAQGYCILHHSVVETGCPRPCSILGSCHATPPNSRRCSWTATSQRFLAMAEKQNSAVSKGRSWPR